MKKLIVLISAAVFAIGCYAQDYKPTSDYGFVKEVLVASSYSWTNDNAYPFRIEAMIFNSLVANTTTVKRVHSYLVNQEVGDVVETNAMGTVETNYYFQVTNVVSTIVTNTLLSATNSGSTIYDKDDISQIYIQVGDVIAWTFSDSSTNLLTFDAVR